MFVTFVKSTGYIKNHIDNKLRTKTERTSSSNGWGKVVLKFS